jgi:uncharacterized protein YaaW (UPF0174 family)
MKYRKDKDLEFLKDCSNEDLELLVRYLTKDKDGKERITESLTEEKKYKEHHPDHKKYWELIAAELQRSGGNTFGNIFRSGEGVFYREILIDVCKKLKVNFNKNSETEIIEANLLMKILLDSVENMDTKDLERLISDLKVKPKNYNKQVMVLAIQSAIKMGGFKSYQIAVMVANAVAKKFAGKGLVLAANAGIAKSMGVFAGPVGWLIIGAWAAIDFAGPDYKVTIPSVIQVAYMRKAIKEE